MRFTYSESLLKKQRYRYPLIMIGIASFGLFLIFDTYSNVTQSLLAGYFYPFIGYALGIGVVSVALYGILFFFQYGIQELKSRELIVNENEIHFKNIFGSSTVTFSDVESVVIEEKYFTNGMHRLLINYRYLVGQKEQIRTASIDSYYELEEVLLELGKFLTNKKVTHVKWGRLIG